MAMLIPDAILCGVVRLEFRLQILSGSARLAGGSELDGLLEEGLR